MPSKESKSPLRHGRLGEPEGAFWPFSGPEWRLSNRPRREPAAGCRLYFGTPPVTRLLTDYLRFTTSPDEQDAYRTLREITLAQDQATKKKLFGKIKRLADRGASSIAIFSTALNHLGGKYLPKNMERAMTALYDLARAGFHPAYEVMFLGMGPIYIRLQKKENRAFMLDVLRHGAEFRSVRCIQLAAECRLKGLGDWDAEAVAENNVQLVDGFYAGSWDCLDLLFRLMRSVPPSMVDPDILDRALDALTTACVDGWTPAMRLRGLLLEEGLLLPAHEPSGSWWLARAHARGDMDAGVELARIAEKDTDFSAKDPESLERRAKVRGLLEEGAACMHARSLSTLARWTLLEQGQEGQAAATSLFASAARLGEVDEWMGVLWRSFLTDPGPETARALDQGVRELTLVTPAASFHLGLYQRYLQTRDNDRSRRRSGLWQSILTHNAVLELNPPACAVLAEAHVHGFGGAAADFRRARWWAKRGMRMHDTRCFVVNALIDFLLIPKNATERFDALVAANYGLLDWACCREDLLAGVLWFCIHSGVGFLEEAPGSTYFPGAEEKESEEELAESMADLLLRSVSDADPGAFACAMYLFRRARGDAHPGSALSLATRSIGYRQPSARERFRTLLKDAMPMMGVPPDVSFTALEKARARAMDEEKQAKTAPAPSPATTPDPPDGNPADNTPSNRRRFDRNAGERNSVDRNAAGPDAPKPSGADPAPSDRDGTEAGGEGKSAPGDGKEARRDVLSRFRRQGRGKKGRGGKS